jgi:hypothetical protein
MDKVGFGLFFGLSCEREPCIISRQIYGLNHMYIVLVKFSEKMAVMMTPEM